MDRDDLESRFAYHAPPNEATKDAHAQVRAWCRRLAMDLNELLPEGRNKSLAMTALEEVMMRSNAAIARDPMPA